MKKEEILSEIRKIEFATRKNVKGGASGLYISAFKGRGIEIEGLREYCESDDFKLIDWNALARTGKPFTQITREERDFQLCFFIDVSYSMRSGGSIIKKRKTKLETAAVLAAVIGFSAVLNKDKVSAILFSGNVEGVVKPAAGREHVLSITEKILDSDTSFEGSSLEAAFSAFPKSLRKKGICVIISDMEYEIPWHIIMKISSAANCMVFRITENFRNNENYFNTFSFEAEGKDPAKYFYVNRFFNPSAYNFAGKTKESVLLEYYNKADNDYKKALKLGIPFTDIYTSDNIAKKVNDFFKTWKK